MEGKESVNKTSLPSDNSNENPKKKSTKKKGKENESNSINIKKGQKKRKKNSLDNISKKQKSNDPVTISSEVLDIDVNSSQVKTSNVTK